MAAGHAQAHPLRQLGDSQTAVVLQLGKDSSSISSIREILPQRGVGSAELRNTLSAIVPSVCSTKRTRQRDQMIERTATRVWVFFYGSYINRDVLAEAGLAPGRWEVACAAGFELVIAPRANLIRSTRDTVWGINATATHDELTRLYTEHAYGQLGQLYLPEAIVTCTPDGTLRPVLTYLCPAMAPAPTDPAYVERIAGPARSLGFPDWYVGHIEGFAR